MTFELGNQYIVDVTERGIIPVAKFDHERYFDLDTDDLEFLTDAEKSVVINQVLVKIRDEITDEMKCRPEFAFSNALSRALDIIDKYIVESETDS